tara:strand:+ start:293 stop:1183 length:891 start_codon:yes stop_codon:yes gene_type:complete
MKKIKIVLLGKTGQIGSVLGKKLKKNNFIKCLSRKDLELSNLSSIGKKLDKLKPNILINAAAYTNVAGAEKNKKLCHKINAASVKKIAQWACKNSCFLLHYSTDYVFDGKNKKPWKENDKTNPINTYGKSKLEGEKFIISSNCKYLILRINWVYSDKGENFPKKIIEKIKKENEIYVVNDQIGTPNHAEFITDITIRILKKIIKHPNTNPKILHLSARGYTTYYKIAKKIYKKLNNKYKKIKIAPISTNKLPGKMKRPLNSKFNVNALENFLDFKLPSWELIFSKKLNKIIKNYDN